MVGPRFRTCWTSEGTESKCCFPSIPVVASIGESRLDETWAGPCGKSVYVELEEVSGLMAEVFQSSQLEVPHLLAQRRCLLRFCWIKEISQFWDPSWTQDSERNFFFRSLVCGGSILDCLPHSYPPSLLPHWHGPEFVHILGHSISSRRACIWIVLNNCGHSIPLPSDWFSCGHLT